MKSLPGLLVACFITITLNADAQQKQSAQTTPDYSNFYYWSAHPYKHDTSDSIPSFLKNEVLDSSVDVFFLHPTTYIKGLAFTSWNADVNDDALNDETDKRPVLYQASVFNGSCRVFAPRYRQAHLKAFFVRNSKRALEAFDTAYADLKRAFEYYLAHYNNHHPIIIASHSQGTLHAIRLIKEFFDGKPLQQQLVCAYLIGYHIGEDEFTALPVCNSPTQTGCFVGWRSYKNGSSDMTIEKENSNSVCVNPLTWTTSTEEASKALHKGMIGRNFNELIEHVVSAQVAPEEKILWVDFPAKLDVTKGLISNYHIMDYNLFYMNIRKRERTNSRV